MVLGNVEETITEVEIDPDTMEELVEVGVYAHDVKISPHALKSTHARHV